LGGAAVQICIHAYFALSFALHMAEHCHDGGGLQKTNFLGIFKQQNLSGFGLSWSSSHRW